jgi:nucleotide-binding universal stress UspA family protein
MTVVLGALEADACAPAILSTVFALAELFGATAAALHVREDASASPQALAAAAGIEFRETPGDPIEQIVAAARAPKVVALVLGARGIHGGPQPAGHAALEIITRLTKPVAVVPPQATVPPRFARILVPLEGTSESSLPLEEMVKHAQRRQIEIFVLHVHSPMTVPAFSDHEPHGSWAWEKEFLDRYIALPHERVSLVRRLGVAAHDVVTAARETAAELIVLAWNQDLTPGRARVVSETLAHSDVPVLLIPTS